MTKRDWVNFARMIRTQKQQLKHIAESAPDTSMLEIEGRRMQIDVFMVHLGELCKSDNPRFDALKFQLACELS